jgi:hypothetical protein
LQTTKQLLCDVTKFEMVSDAKKAHWDSVLIWNFGGLTYLHFLRVGAQ